MSKERRTITVDPRVWAATQEEARRQRVSHSWVTETALRRYLKIRHANQSPDPEPSPQPAA